MSSLSGMKDLEQEFHAKSQPSLQDSEQDSLQKLVKETGNMWAAVTRIYRTPVNFINVKILYKIVAPFWLEHGHRAKLKKTEAET